MSNQNIRRWDGGQLQQRIKFVYDAFGSSWHGADVAPAQTSAVVGDDAIRSSKFAADVGPAKICGHQPSFENNCWASSAFLEQMQTMSSEINEFARRWVKSTVFAFSESLVGDADQDAEQHQSGNPD